MGIEDEMVGWHHQLDGYEFEQALRVGGEAGDGESWGHFRKSSRPEAGSSRTPHQLPTAANPGALWVKSPPPPTSSHASPTPG